MITAAAGEPARRPDRRDSRSGGPVRGDGVRSSGRALGVGAAGATSALDGWCPPGLHLDDPPPLPGAAADIALRGWLQGWHWGSSPPPDAPGPAPRLWPRGATVRPRSAATAGSALIVDGCGHRWTSSEGSSTTTVPGQRILARRLPNESPQAGPASASQTPRQPQAPCFRRYGDDVQVPSPAPARRARRRSSTAPTATPTSSCSQIRKTVQPPSARTASTRRSRSTLAASFGTQ